MGSSQVHINFIILALSVFILVISRFGRLGEAWIYYLLLIVFQVSLVLSIILYNSDELLISYWPSIFRPFLLAVTFTAIYFYMQNGWFSYSDISKVLIFFTYISSFYFIMEIVLLDYFDFIVYNFYKREYKDVIRYVFSSFFGTSYYSGFVYFSIMAILLPFASKYKKFHVVFSVFLCVFFIIAAQSKTMIAAMFAYLFFYIYLASSHATKLLTLTLLMTALFFIFVFYNEIKNIIYHASEVYKLKSISSLKKLMLNPNESGTLTTRVEQIKSVYENLTLLGYGTGKGVDLESWLAKYMYRYGLIGVIFFLLFHIYMAFRLLFIFFKNKESEVCLEAYISLSFSIWFALIPITQISSAMIDGSKMMWIYMFILSFSFVLIFKSNYRHVLSDSGKIQCV